MSVSVYVLLCACSSRAEQDVSGPLQDNAKHCDQCFCYICDKLASTVSPLASNLGFVLVHETCLQMSGCYETSEGKKADYIFAWKK